MGERQGRGVLGGSNRNQTEECRKEFLYVFAQHPGSIKKPSVIAEQSILTVEIQVIKPNASCNQRDARVPPHPIDFARLNSRLRMAAFVVKCCSASLVIAVVCVGPTRSRACDGKPQARANKKCVRFLAGHADPIRLPHPLIVARTRRASGEKSENQNEERESHKRVVMPNSRPK